MSERSRGRRFPLTLDAVVERKPAERQRETRISSGVNAVSRPTPARTASAERASSAPGPGRFPPIKHCIFIQYIDANSMV
ncbi:hypothetical protein ACQCQ6_23270, partial [Ralstonia pseudosolanacearum]